MEEWFIVLALSHMIFSVLFLLTKKKRDISDIVLSVWLFFLVIPFAGRLLGFFIGHREGPMFTLATFPLTYGPFMLLYSRLIIRNKAKKILPGLFHFIPFILFSIVQIIFPYAFGFNGPRRMNGLSLLEQVFNIGVLISISIYTVSTLVLLTKHRKSVMNYLSYTSIQATMVWLFVLVIFNLANFFLLTIIDLFLLNFPIPVHGTGPLIFLYLLSFFGMRQSLIYRDLLSSGKPDRNRLHHDSSNLNVLDHDTLDRDMKDYDLVNENLSERGAKYIKSGLSDQVAEDVAEKLNSYMDEEKPYLEEELTIELLSQRLAIPRHYLTQVINERFNKNFFNFINEYRVLAVKDKIAQKESDRYTILALAFDCGFNSKTTFNAAFKKIAGMTPSQYKNMVRS